MSVSELHEPMMCEWVVGRAVGERAKSVMEHAAAGLSYFILEQGKQGSSNFCLYAFLRPNDSPIPEHLTRVVDPFQLKKLNERRDSRRGAENRRTDGPGVSPAKLQEVKDLFNTKRLERAPKPEVERTTKESLEDVHNSAEPELIQEPGQVPVKQNPDGSREMPDDFLLPEKSPEDLF